MQEILGKAIEAYRRKRLLEAANEFYAALRKGQSLGACRTQIVDGTLAYSLDKA